MKRRSLEEIKEAIGSIKDGKAAGLDGIPSEVWKYGGKEIEEWIWNLCKKYRRGRVSQKNEKKRR